MLRTKFKKTISYILTVSMCLGTAVFMPAPKADASQLSSLQSQQKELQGQQSDVESTLSELKGEQSKIIEYKTALDQKSAIIMKEILNLEEQIQIQDNFIEEKSVEVDAAQKVADEQLVKLKGRIRAMEETGRFNYLAVILGASTIGEFLSLMDDVGEIMKSDKALEDSYIAAVDTFKAARKEYEDAKDKLMDDKSEQEALQKELQKDIDEANAIIADLQADINTNKDLLAQLNSQESDIRAQIAALTQPAVPSGGGGGGGSSSGGGSAVGSGSLIWPVGSYYITSLPGGRVNPVTGIAGTHTGVDIGASYGSPIYAADSGTVVTSADGWNGGYGNYVIISHGSKTTLYAHMSSRAVSPGQTVSQGQVIGYVGSTGNSTGAHLHYEVYSGGAWTDPLSYYGSGSFSYAPDA